MARDILNLEKNPAQDTQTDDLAIVKLTRHMVIATYVLSIAAIVSLVVSMLGYFSLAASNDDIHDEARAAVSAASAAQAQVQATISQTAAQRRLVAATERAQIASGQMYLTAFSPHHIELSYLYNNFGNQPAFKVTTATELSVTEALNPSDERDIASVATHNIGQTCKQLKNTEGFMIPAHGGGMLLKSKGIRAKAAWAGVMRKKGMLIATVCVRYQTMGELHVDSWCGYLFSPGKLPAILDVCPGEPFHF